jgi:hypothetical protein
MYVLLIFIDPLSQVLLSSRIPTGGQSLMDNHSLYIGCG